MATTKKKSEALVDKEVVLALAQWLRIVLFRNNVGAFKNPSNGQWTRYGLANESKQMNQRTKSSDRIGWTPVEITPEMVGKTVAVFTAIEMKEEGHKPSGKRQVEHVEAQQRFCDTVTKAGGIAGIVDSVEAAKQLIAKYLEKLGG